MEYRKIQDRFFVICHHGAFFLVYTYPMQVFRLDVSEMAEAAALAEELWEDGSLALQKRSEDFKNFFSLDWLITADCNLNCAHCFAKKTGERYRYGLLDASLTMDDLRKSVCLALDVLAGHLQPDDPSIRFELFIIGGEPLLEKDLICQGIRYLDGELERFRAEHGLETVDRQAMIVSNGIAVDREFAQFCRDWNIGITISVDAPGYMQKVDSDGENHTPKVMENLKLLLEHHVENVAVNFVIPPDRLDDTDLVFEYLEREGVLRHLKTVQMSPQIPPHRQTLYCGCNPSEVVISDFGADMDSCRLFAKKMLGYDRKYHMDIKEYNQKMFSLIEIGGMAYRCPAAQNKFCVVPGGDIYPCHQLIQIDGFRMGGLNTATPASLEASDAYQSFSRRRVFQVEPCRDCLLQTVCITFVDCPARCHLESGDLFHVPKHYCLIAKEYLEEIFGRFLDSLPS